MRTATLLAASVLLAAPMSFAQSVDHSQVPAMLGWINAARAQHGAPALTEDPRLDALAEAHSVDMAAHHYFDHVSPTQGSPSQRASAAGVGYRELAENIALDQSPRAAFDALMHSPGHYANLMNPGLHAVGLGLVNGPDGVYVTQSFATFDNDVQPAPASLPLVTMTPIPPPAQPTPAGEPSVSGTAPTDNAVTSALPNVDLQALRGMLATLLQGNTAANTLPALGGLTRAGSLADLARIAQATNVPVRVTPRRGNSGHSAYDVQTPYGNFTVSMADDARASTPVAPCPAASPTALATEPVEHPAAPVAAQPWTGSF